MQTTIKLFLMDGNSNGRIKCSFSSGWNGCCYKIPSSDLNKSDNIEILKSAGVYFLFGYDESDNEVVYIGQGNVRQNGQGVLQRIKEPHNQINDWKTCVVFVANGDFQLGPTELNYLEHNFTEMSKIAGRYKVKNGNTPNPAKLSEEDQADMNLFVENATILLDTLGYKVLEPLRPKIEVKSINNNIINNNIYTYSFVGLKAKGINTDEGFVVLKGSQIIANEKISNVCKDRVIQLRKKYAEKLKDNVIKEDILFRSSSGAATFCSGQSRSGPKCWIDINGISLENKKTS